MRLLLLTALIAPITAMAGTFTSLHPEEAHPDDAPLLASPGDHADLFREVQQRLHDFGFNPGPVNGDFGAKTQAALAQFQISRDLPASGMLDEKTRVELGLAE